MASPSIVKLSTEVQPVAYYKLRPESADKTSEILQENHERYHIYFNSAEFHNHIAHHLLTIYALGAAPEVIQEQYESNRSYQRPATEYSKSIVQDLHDPTKFKECLGRGAHYNDFLKFFQEEIVTNGCEEVMNKYLFSGDERADDMLSRLFGGFLHPIIHLGFGIEFQQPAIIAEALAQTAVHKASLGQFFLAAEIAANKTASNPSKSLVKLLDEIYQDEDIKRAVKWEGTDMLYRLIQRAGPKMIEYASQFTVKVEELEEKTAEMINAVSYFAICAQHPPKEVKVDFFYMHAVNCSIFFSSFLKQQWLSNENKARLLEWKGRVDLALYASQGPAELMLEEISQYKPRESVESEHDSWERIFDRVARFKDDGHAAKLIRALAHAKAVSEPYQDKDSFRLKDNMWGLIGHMAIDSVEASKPEFVRACGFDQAWESVAERSSGSV